MVHKLNGGRNAPTTKENKMELFLNNLVEKKELHDGVQFIFRFDNNYGASVVRHEGSYGGEAGLFELAVLQYGKYKSNLDEFEIVYHTNITNDVIGFLEPRKVATTLRRINKLNG